MTFLGLQRTACFGGRELSASFVATHIAEAACPVSCPAASNQKCGGNANATGIPVSAYRASYPPRRRHRPPRCPRVVPATIGGSGATIGDRSNPSSWSHALLEQARREKCKLV